MNLQELKTLFGSRSKGQSGVVATIVGVVLASLVLIIGLVVFGTFESSVGHGSLTSAASTQINQTVTQTYNGFDIGAVIPLVLFATAIIGVLLAAFSFARNQ